MFFFINMFVFSYFKMRFNHVVKNSEIYWYDYFLYYGLAKFDDTLENYDTNTFTTTIPYHQFFR
jgi:hypothetical protein